jgi:2-polyprenyl-3-methyl-5-hydroxy-6-metoxy-1,4-benzoquinol methylase
MGYLLASPLRKLFENPGKILAPHVRSGMRVLDAGCAMGFFSLPLARLVGPDGKVVCVDVQERMIATLMKRARRKGLSGILDARVCEPGRLGIEDLSGKVDLVLAFHVVHETDDPAGFLAECFAVLRPGGRMLLAEPAGHVSAAAFDRTVADATAAGFTVLDQPLFRRSRARLLEKPAA